MYSKDTWWLCRALWLLGVCCVLHCTGATGRRAMQKHGTGLHDFHSQNHQMPHNPKKYCNQPPGAITQKCGVGFYRELTGPHRGRCVPCSCNGLSNECNPYTGKCNCQFNTDGDQCERCKEGYFGNAAQKTCHPCPCPFTWNNFALACLNISSGAVECICKLGYGGTRCERCASGYYGDPMKYGSSCRPCNCNDESSLNICDSLTGECLLFADADAGDHCYECDSCNQALLNDLESMDDDKLARLSEKLQKTSQANIPQTLLKRLEAGISKNKILVESYITTVNGQVSKIGHFEADADIVREDIGQVIDTVPVHKTLSDYEKVLEKVEETNLKAGDIFSEVQALFTAIKYLIKQLSEVKPGESNTAPEWEVARMTEKAQRIVQEMRKAGCPTQREHAGKEQEEAHILTVEREGMTCSKGPESTSNPGRCVLDSMRDNMTVPLNTNQALTNHTAVSLMTSGSSLPQLAKALTNAEDTVARVQGFNLQSDATLKDLLERRALLEKEQNVIHREVEMTKDQEFKQLSTQLDGARLYLFEKVNNISQDIAKVDVLIRAEEHAAELAKLARDFQLNISSGLLSVIVGTGADNIINAIEKAEVAANQSKATVDQAFEDVEGEDVANVTEGLTESASQLETDANDTRASLQIISDKVDSYQDHVNERRTKAELLRKDILPINDNIKRIRRDDIGLLLDSAKEATSASNNTVTNVTDRLRNLIQKVDKLNLTDATANIDGMLGDAEMALKSLNTMLPTLTDNLTQIHNLHNKAPPSANMSDSIRRIKDVIKETRNFVNRLSSATIFNGKGHIELHTPRNLEDLKAFTAVDLFLNRHQKTPSSADSRRKRRQDKQNNANLFVFYLGNKNSSGDYIGMAIKNNIFVCVYKLGGVVHKIETSRITTTAADSAIFDRVIFHRVYQDAEVNITQNFTSSKPVSWSLKHELPNTAIGVLNLDPQSVVIYVGGYPDSFTPPVELRHPKYHGAIKLSFLNDNPFCLFNYKHAVNISEKQPYVKVRQSEFCSYYEGTGYGMALISNPDHIKRRLFKFHTNSRETNALLFYIANENSYFCVFVERGHLVLRGRQGGRELRAQSDEKVSLFNKRFIILLDDDFTVAYEQKTISTDYVKTSYRSFYIGGLPTQLRERDNITAPPLRGCVDKLNADSRDVEYSRTTGVSDGCPESLLGVRMATFNLGSSLSLTSVSLWEKPPIMVSLGFRTTEQSGAFLRTSYQGSASIQDFQLFLADGFVVFICDNHALKSQKPYNDGSWHYVTAMKNTSVMELRVDNFDMGHAHPHNTKSRTAELILGGKTFKGCIANLYTRRPTMSFIPADLSSSSQRGNVVLGVYRPSHSDNAMLLPAALRQIPKKSKNVQVQLSPTDSQCRQPTAHYGEYHLSRLDSWLTYNVSPEDLNYRPHFSFEIRTKSSKGLLLHVAGEGDISLVALYMTNGKIKLSLGHNRVIYHKKKSNDGNWHRVVFSVERNTFHLVVDGFRVTDGYLSNNEGSFLKLQNPVYLGSDPTHKTSEKRFIPKESVVGCIRDFRLNEIVIGEAGATYGVSSCFNGLSETGTYFGGNGGHVVIDKYFTVGSHFELAFELRPTHLTGLLFHCRSHKTSFTVFLMGNKVGVELNDGETALSTSVTPPRNLCDGKFHAVTVSRGNDFIQLEVDSVSEQKVGPSPTNPHYTTLDSLYVGGISGAIKPNRVSVSSSFVGCLRNVRVNGKPVVFDAATRVVDPVTINKCPVY